MGDKLLTENCRVCGKKIHIDRGFGWVDLGPPEVSEFSKHADWVNLWSNYRMISKNQSQGSNNNLGR